MHALNPMIMPMTKFPQFFGGAFGVPNSTSPLGLRHHPDAVVIYVDSGYPAASDNTDGTDPLIPKATVQSAISSSILTPGSIILVSGDVSEQVVTPDATTGPNYVRVIGQGNHHAPTWGSPAAAQIALDIRATGWSVSGFTFNAPTAAASVRLSSVPASNYDAYKSTLYDNVFDGLWGGLYGIEFFGAPHRIEVLSNHFIEFRQAAAAVGYAIMVTDSTNTNPYECLVAGNRFTECEGHVSSLGGIRGFNVSTFRDNIHEAGVLIPTTVFLDLRGGSRGENTVVNNFFAGDYSNTGGYYAHAANPGSWVGNIAQDVAEAEVADNGFTIAVPAA